MESTDGFTWVIQAVGAGLLPAFCDCSSYFSKFDSDQSKYITGIFAKVVPTYLGYKSDIEAVEVSLQQLT